MKITQFELRLNKEVTVKGECEGNAKSGKVVVFSHGFGVTRDSRGMFSELGDVLKDEYLVVRFDYTREMEDGKSRYLNPYSIQKSMLQKVIQHVKDQFDVKEMNLIGHSMGGIIIGLLDPVDVHKVVLVASPISSPYRRMKEYFSRRKGTVIDEKGESRIAKSDGSVSILDKNYWREMKGVNPLERYASLATKTRIYYIRALEDQVVTNQDYTLLEANPDIKYMEMHGDHDFSGKDRKAWHDKVVELIHQ
jgi:pimeloyl-ACP methyl ester carboxylesterase